MRWDSLFDDLESQLEHELNAEDIDLRAEEHRLRLGRLTLRDRLMSLSASDPGSAEFATIELVTGSVVRIVPRMFGRDWIAADLVTPDGASGSCIVPLDAVTGVVIAAARAMRSIPSHDADEHGSRLTDRIGLAFALRDLCRRRSYVHVHTVNGVHRGTIDRVGRDHVDLAVHEPGTSRREREVRHQRIVPFSALALVEM